MGWRSGHARAASSTTSATASCCPSGTSHGRVVAFIGRAPDDRDARTPKYLNSPHTAIYHKAERLFGVGSQPLADRRVILVEGPLDVLAVHAAVPAVAAIAPCGTAFTEAQAKILAAAGVRDLVVAFDADRGGRAAAVKAYGTLRPHISSPLVAQLPDATDPASLAETNPADLARAVTEQVRPLSDFVVDERIAQWQGQLDSPEGRSLAARDLGALLATMPATEVPRQVTRTADAIGILHSTMTAVVAEAIAPSDRPAGQDKLGRGPTGQADADRDRPDSVRRQSAGAGQRTTVTHSSAAASTSHDSGQGQGGLAVTSCGPGPSFGGCKARKGQGPTTGASGGVPAGRAGRAHRGRRGRRARGRLRHHHDRGA